MKDNYLLDATSMQNRYPNISSNGVQSYIDIWLRSRTNMKKYDAPPFPTPTNMVGTFCFSEYSHFRRICARMQVRALAVDQGQMEFPAYSRLS